MRVPIKSTSPHHGKQMTLVPAEGGHYKWWYLNIRFFSKGDPPPNCFTVGLAALSLCQSIVYYVLTILETVDKQRRAISLPLSIIYPNQQ